MSFRIETDFAPSENGSAEEKATMAQVRIVAGSDVLTRVNDSWAQSVRESVRVACYPLAMWVANSWWRLFHEAASTQKGAQPSGWRSAHEVRSAGAGFVWPRVTFTPDGETVEVTSRPSDAVKWEPVRYLTRATASFPASDVQQELARFVAVVIARLDALGVKNSELSALWQEIEVEQRDPTLRRARALEAGLGFDPDEGPASVISSLLSFDAAVADELANAVHSSKELRREPTRLSAFVDAARAGGGLRGRFDSMLAGLAVPVAPPWVRGRAVARSLREAMALQSGPVSDASLSQLLGATLTESASGAPVGLAVSEAGDGEARLFFRRARHTSQRFEAARFIVHRALQHGRPGWSVSTDAATATQKAQRAGATEFLVPIDELSGRLDGDYSEDAIDEAAAYFQVSPLTVEAHLANNGFMDASRVRST